MHDIARLVPTDEGLNHQIPQTFAAVLHSDPTWTEKIWTTIARKDGSLQVDFGLGKYTNLNVIDGFGGVSMGRKQWTVRASRALFPDSEKSAVGPLEYSVIEPLKRVRFVLAENKEAAVSFELDFEAALPPYFEDRHIQRSNTGSRAVADLVRYHQAGTVSGTIRVDGKTYQVKPDEWFAFRDHSWGIRPGVGQPANILRAGSSATNDPIASGFDPQARFFLNWSPIVLQTPQGTQYEFQYYYMAAGDVPFYSSGYVNHPDGSQERIISIRPELTYHPKTRMLTGGKIHFQTQPGKTRTIEVEPVGESGFYLGLGLYFGLDGFNHGMWRGPLHVEGEYVENCLNRETLERIHQLRDRPIRVREGDASGYGIMESTVTGEWPSLGLSREDSYV